MLNEIILNDLKKFIFANNYSNIYHGLIWFDVDHFRLFLEFYNVCDLLKTIFLFAIVRLLVPVRKYFIRSYCFLYFLVRHGLKEPKKMEDLQLKIIDCLRDHCTYNSEAQKKTNFFSIILGKIAELRTLSREGLQRLFYFQLENIIQAPPIIESLFLSSQLPFWIKNSRV